MAQVKKTGAVWIPAGVIIALGLVALAYIWGADLKQFKNPRTVEKQSPQTSSGLIKVQNQIKEKLPELQKSQALQSKEALNGSWKMEFGDNRIAVLTIAGDSFQLIVTDSVSGRYRQYSRGQIKHDPQRAILSLIPDKAAGAPKPIEGVVYKILTMRSYDMQVASYKGDPHLYLVALQKDLLAKTYHPLFKSADHSGAPVLKWTKVE
ncbi:MAG: hypothetical protein OEY94_02575 [Alphaproteobacteria bacterium]|nr:hypothetical protein [Alphaproteobacteria bacterium]